MSNEGDYSLEQPILRTISFLLSPNLIPGMFKMKNKDISCHFRKISCNFSIIQNSLIFIARGSDMEKFKFFLFGEFYLFRYDLA